MIHQSIFFISFFFFHIYFGRPLRLRISSSKAFTATFSSSLLKHHDLPQHIANLSHPNRILHTQHAHHLLSVFVGVFNQYNFFTNNCIFSVLLKIAFSFLLKHHVLNPFIGDQKQLFVNLLVHLS